MSIRRQEALDYHSRGRPGKIQVSPTKPFKNQRDLSLAYTPGVAEPCREIAAHPDDAYSYTAKGNLVAVVTNGTAVLGLGNIGALAGKPVMEGKGILFKAFADIDVFDLEVGSDDPRDLVRFCQLLEPTVGRIRSRCATSGACCTPTATTWTSIGDASRCAARLALWPQRSRTPMCSWACRWAGSSAARCSRRWRPGRSCSPSRTQIRKSARR